MSPNTERSGASREYCQTIIDDNKADSVICQAADVIPMLYGDVT
jgi:hypothetical protein